MVTRKERLDVNIPSRLARQLKEVLEDTNQTKTEFITRAIKNELLRINNTGAPINYLNSRMNEILNSQFSLVEETRQLKRLVLEIKNEME